MSDMEATPLDHEAEATETPAEVPENTGEGEGTEDQNGDEIEMGEDDEEEMTVDLDALPKMKVAELKDILKALDLPTSGIKTTLIERIQHHFAEEDQQEEVAAEEKVAETEEKELLNEVEEAVPEYIEVKKSGEEVKEGEQAPAATAAAAAVIKVSNEKEKSDEEKKKDRAEKFGLLSDDDKKEKRAAKFGVDTDKSIESKKEERAAKFGINTPNSLADKKAQRAARFSNSTSSVPIGDSGLEDEKLKKRRARFNLESEPVAKNAKLVTLDEVSEKLKEKIESGSTQVNLSAGSLSLEEKKKLRALKFGA